MVKIAKPPKRKYRINEKERAARRERVQQAREELPTTITLTRSHLVNSVRYGPGAVTVSGSMARSLLEADRRAQEAEVAFQGTKAVIIGPQVGGVHVTRQVPMETFSSSLDRAEPAITQFVGNKKE